MAGATSNSLPKSDMHNPTNIYLYHKYLQALNKKEGGKGSLGSPDGMGGDSDGELDSVTTTTTTTAAVASSVTAATTLTPRTEAKYNRIDEEFQLMMHRNQLNGGGGGGTNAAVRAVSDKAYFFSTFVVVGTTKKMMSFMKISLGIF